MELSLERPLLFFDIESTGLSIVNDCIVELSFVKVFPDHHHEVKTWRVCPWDYTLRRQHPIDPGASTLFRSPPLRQRRHLAAPGR